MAKAPLCNVSDIPVFQQKLRDIKAKHGEESKQMEDALMQYSGPSRGLKWNDDNDTLTVCEGYVEKDGGIYYINDVQGPGFN